jgi:hypothetical protein
MNIRLIRIKDFLRSDVHGVYDLESTKRLMRELARASVEQGNRHILLDGRSADASGASVTDVWELAASLLSMGFAPGTRIALLYTFPKHKSDYFDRAAFLETCASNRGFNLRSFREFEKALSWLAMENEGSECPWPERACDRFRNGMHSGAFIGAGI